MRVSEVMHSFGTTVRSDERHSDRYAHWNRPLLALTIDGSVHAAAGIQRRALRQAVRELHRQLRAVEPSEAPPPPLSDGAWKRRSAHGSGGARSLRLPTPPLIQHGSHRAGVLLVRRS